MTITATWVGNTSTFVPKAYPQKLYFWDTPSNWDIGVVPNGPQYEVIFNTTEQLTTVWLKNNYSIGSLTVTGDSSNQLSIVGQDLNVNGNFFRYR